MNRFRIRLHVLNTGVAAAAALLLSACSFMPTYERPASTRGSGFS